MLYFESMRMAWIALCSNKLRSLLTMLGIIIGVGAVIAMVSIGMGVRKSVNDSIGKLGGNLLIIMPGATNNGGVQSAAGSATTLTYDDAEAIKRQVRNINCVSPVVNSAYQIVYENKNWNSSVYGVTPEYMEIQSFTVKGGSFITESDLSKRTRVAVIGKTVANKLFGASNPVGQNIRVNNSPYKVIGVLRSKGQSSMGQNQDDVVIIPLTTAQERMLGITHVHSINVQVIEQSKMSQAQSDIKRLLRQRHHIIGEKEDDFTVENLANIMEAMSQTTAMITLFLGSIAGISLVVGGIGIMNIMTVSVTERTREIGIRKALGATFRNIMMQFLIESVVISVAGGIIGIILGYMTAHLISIIGKFTAVITIPVILLAFLFSVGIGLFFGVYPARKAAKLDPIEALRYE